MRHASCPIRCGGPAIIQHQQQRAGLAGAGCWLPNGAGEAQNNQPRHDQAQQQQPPGRARRRGLGGLQFAQNARGWEDLALGRGRRDPQQPPQYRQRRQCQQQPRGGEADGAEGQHHPASSR